MKAVYVSKVGDTLDLTYGDLPEPVIADPFDMIVRVRATAMNRHDVFSGEGTHDTTERGGIKLPFITGWEYAGDVVEVGPQVTRFKVGDRVFGPSVFTHAEFVRARAGPGLPQEAVEPIPSNLSYEDAAAIPRSFCVAWHMLHCRGNLRTGEDVLVMGAGSGTGSSGIQLCKAAGARVITTANTNDKLEKAKALGADEVIDSRRTPEFSGRVLELTDGQGVDVIFEHIGTPVWESCIASLKRGGRFITCGVTAGHRVSLHLGNLWRREQTLIGASTKPQDDFETLRRLAGRGVIRGVVDSVFLLEAYKEAWQRMKSREFFGKVILTIP